MHSIKSRWPHENTIKVEWNLGKRCNYDCTYCPAEIHDNHSPHTDIGILKSAVRELVKAGNIRLSFTGGEPSVHPQIEKLLSYSKEQGVKWINMTTNGTRLASWYKEQEKFIDHYNFSIHFENDWLKVLSTIIEYNKDSDIPKFVNVMAHHDYMNEVRHVVNDFKENAVPFALRRIRWTEGDHDDFDDERYSPEDKEWLLSQTATAEPNTLIDNDRLMHPNDIIKEHLNQFKGWQCNIGLESLMINWDGYVHRATCRVGGSLGNIYQGTFIPPTDPIICDRNWCTCAADIPITKSKV